MTDQNSKKNNERNTIDEVLGEIGIIKLNLKQPARRLMDVLNEIQPEGEPAKLREFEGREITIVAVRFFSGQYGPGAYVIFTDENGALFNMVCGQEVILPKLAMVRDQLPLTATVVKREGGSFGGYFDFE